MCVSNFATKIIKIILFFVLYFYIPYLYSSQLGNDAFIIQYVIIQYGGSREVERSELSRFSEASGFVQNEVPTWESSETRVFQLVFQAAKPLKSAHGR